MLLKKGDNNEQVKQLQVKLHLDPVGNFGPKTEEAVKMWQSAHGLTADGIVGDKTWAMIMGEEEHPQVQQQAVAVSNSTGLKLEKLKGHIPDAVIAMIPAVAQKFQIDSALRTPYDPRNPPQYRPEHRPDGWLRTMGVPVCGTRLFLAKPFAELILYRISNCGI